MLILGAAAEVTTLARDNVHEKIQLFKVAHPHTYPFRSRYWDLCKVWYEFMAHTVRIEKTLKGMENG
jgi:hypothetical protein